MKKHPTKTQITRILNECKFNPKTPGTLKIIADVGSIEYYQTRAIELIAMCDKVGPHLRKERLTRAISLLALAIACEET